jgi:hypothetical protein
MAATLTAHLKLDRSGFAAGLKSARKNLADFSAGARSLAAGAVGGGLLALGAGASIAAVGLAAGVKSAYDLGGTLNDLSTRTGISAGKLLILRQAFVDNGLAADDVGSSVNKMQKFLSAASDSASPAAKVIQGLGLELSALSTMTPDKQLQAIGRSIASISSPTDRAAASMAIFGKSGGKFLTLFADKGGIDTAARSLGKQAAILDKSAAAFDDISDKLGRAGTKLQGFFVGVAATLASTIGPLLDRFDATDFSGIGLKFGASLMAAADIFIGAFRDPQKAFGAMGSYLDGVMAQSGNVLAAAFQSATNIFGASVSSIIQGIGRLLLGTLLDSFSDSVAYFQASVQATLALMNPKNAVDALQLKVADSELSYQRKRMEKTAASGDNAGMQDAMNQIGLLTQRANEISARMTGGSVEERKAAILAAGGPTINMGADGPMNAAGLKTSGAEMLARGAASGVAAAKGFTVPDLFGAQAKFASAAPMVADLQSSGGKIRKAATAVAPDPVASSQYEAQLFEQFGKVEGHQRFVRQKEKDAAQKGDGAVASSQYEAQLFEQFGKAEGHQRFVRQKEKDAAQKSGGAGTTQNPTAEKSLSLQEQMAKALADLLKINQEAWGN